MITKIISGGQTRADQAALDFAIEHDIPHGGWIPKGRKTETGILPDKYKLDEMPTASYPKRTERNILDSDGTLIFSRGKLTGGPAVTYESANGDRFVARYGSLSDGTLHFVKVKMPNGREYTLPQAVSGSGARYTDDREIVWWEHHGTVRVDVRAADGKWKTKYPDLKMVHGK